MNEEKGVQLRKGPAENNSGSGINLLKKEAAGFKL